MAQTATRWPLATFAGSAIQRIRSRATTTRSSTIAGTTRTMRASSLGTVRVFVGPAERVALVLGAGRVLLRSAGCLLDVFAPALHLLGETAPPGTLGVRLAGLPRHPPSPWFAASRSTRTGSRLAGGHVRGAVRHHDRRPLRHTPSVPCAAAASLWAPARAPDSRSLRTAGHPRMLGAGRPVWPHPEASPPCGRCARWGAARLAASWPTGGAPLPGARWEGEGENVVPTARSGGPPCAVRRVRHVLEPIARRVTMGGWLTCWRRCIPLTSRSHGASVQARTGPFASLTPVASLWPSPACGSSAPTSFRVERRTVLRSITTTPGERHAPWGTGTGCLRRRPAATERAGQRSQRGAAPPPPAAGLDPESRMLSAPSSTAPTSSIASAPDPIHSPGDSPRPA
jgi:hypothetical protein